MHHLWVHQKARSFLMELRFSRVQKYYPINNLWIYDNILSLECITTNVERRNGTMLDSGTTKRCAVRMGSTKLVKKVNINNFIANIVHYLPVRMRVRKFNKRIFLESNVTHSYRNRKCRYYIDLICRAMINDLKWWADDDKGLWRLETSLEESLVAINFSGSIRK